MFFPKISVSQDIVKGKELGGGQQTKVAPQGGFAM